MNKKIVFIINVDWYFCLHWVDRARYFKSLGYNVHIVTNFSEKITRKELSAMGFVCHHFFIKRNSLNPFFEIFSIRELKKILEVIKPDLIHCVTIKPNIYAGLVNRFYFNKPIIYSITGLGAIFSSSALKFVFLKRLIILLYKLISVNYAKFIFENNDDYNLFLKRHILKENNGSVIKGAGINLERFLAFAPPNNKSVLFAARLLKDKGLYQLIEAKRVLEKKGLVFTLNVAGIIDTDVSSAIPITQIELWARNGDINWLGNVKDMPELIKKNAIVCLPTTYGEGVPRILIEAAACQRPIITSDVVGCREIVEHNVNGLLAKAGSVESLVDCLYELLNNTEKSYKFGVCGRRKVEQEFSQEMVFEKTLKIYQSLLGIE